MQMSDLEDAPFLARENRRLNKTVEQLQLQLTELQRAVVDRDVSAVLQQKDDVIRRLKELVKSHESVAAKLRRSNQRYQQSGDLEPLIAQLERAVQAFQMESLPLPGELSARERLQAVVDALGRVRDVFAEQRRSVDRLTSLCASQHSVIMRISGQSASGD
jgi:DNA-binding SARP family transcriptional activator